LGRTTWHTAHRWDLEWQDDVDVLTLRSGVQVKVYFQDPDEQQTDLLIKFPAGYVEPEHAHHSTHAILVLEGLQIAQGEHQRPGDYLWAAADVPHGPFEYPEGCVVFGSFRGPSAQHRYPGSPGGEI
jgi:anti-sigma factor ChrR (cupin superfamily)